MCNVCRTSNKVKVRYGTADSAEEEEVDVKNANLYIAYEILKVKMQGH
jgi:hypothetical protein